MWVILYNFFYRNCFVSSMSFFTRKSTSSLYVFCRWKKHWPMSTSIIPGKISMNPIIEKFPGKLCMFPKSIKKQARNGYSVMAIAGMIGSGNILVTIKTETIWPKARTIAMYKKEVKWESLNILNIPQNGSKSKVAPLKK